MGQKVTEQVAEMRSLPAGIDQRSPARHPDWLGPDDLSLKIQEIREATNYEIPIQLKLGAARVYDDVRMAAKCGPDIIYLDGAEGGTGAGPHVAAEETGIPLMAAIPEARRALEDVGLADEIDLVVAGGIRNGGDVAKCLALGAKAVAIGHSALMALNCNKEIPGVTDYEGTVGVPAGQCYHCHTGRCPVGVTTQDPELRKRLVVDDAANRVYNFLHTLTLECQMLARACGKTDVHNLEPEDLCALTVEAAAMARVPLAGTNYIPGPERGARARRDQAPARAPHREPDRLPRARGPRPRESTSRSTHTASRGEPEKIDRRSTPSTSPGRRFPYQEDIVAARRRRPAGRDAGQGHQLARGRHAARGGGHAGGLRPLLELVHQDLLPDPGGARGRDRAQGADQAPAVGQLVRDRAEGAPLQVPPARARPVGRGLAHGRDRLEARRCSRAGSPRRIERWHADPALPRSVREGRGSRLTCKCGERRYLQYGERWTCEKCGRSWDTLRIPLEEYAAMRRAQLRDRIAPDRGLAWSSRRVATRLRRWAGARPARSWSPVRAGSSGATFVRPARTSPAVPRDRRAAPLDIEPRLSSERDGHLDAVHGRAAAHVALIAGVEHVDVGAAGLTLGPAPLRRVDRRRAAVRRTARPRG